MLTESRYFMIQTPNPRVSPINILQVKIMAEFYKFRKNNPMKHTVAIFWREI